MKRQNKKAISLLGSVALAGCMGLGIGCKKDNPITPPVPITLQFEVYNHTEGYRTSFTRNTTSGQNVNIKISDLGYNDVDLERIAVREKNMGPLANFGRTGEANFIATTQNLSYDIFLMNKSNGTNYQLVDDRQGYLFPPRNAKWMRQDDDGKTGPEEAIEDVVSQFNQALNPGWITYGNLNQVSSGGDIKIGYGLCLWNGVPVGGKHGMYPDGTCRIWVNAEVCRATGRNIIGVFIEELFESLTYTSDIHGDGSHVNGEDRYLTLEGKELLTYVYAKDEKTK